MIPGEIIYKEGDVELNLGSSTVRFRVENRGDRPIQIGSHFHFFEVNRALRFDRKAAFAKHLDIPAGTAVRFEPGDDKDVELVEFGGKKKIYGFNGLTQGKGLLQAMTQAKKKGFLS